MHRTMRNILADKDPPFDTQLVTLGDSIQAGKVTRTAVAMTTRLTPSPADSTRARNRIPRSP